MSENRAIVTRQPASEVELIRDLADVLKVSQYVADSKLFGCDGAPQAFVKILAGRAMGFDPITSMSSIHIIEGKPSPGADLIAAAIRRKGSGYDYETVEVNDDVAHLKFYRLVGDSKKLLGEVRYTFEECSKKGWHLTANGKPKQTWIQKRANMLFARAITDGKRFYCPDVLTSVFDRDEIDSPAFEKPTPVPAQVVTKPNVVNPQLGHEPERPTELVVNDDGSLSDSVDAMTECRARIEALQNELGVSTATMRSRLISNFQVESIHELHDLPSLQKLEQMLLSAKAARQKGKTPVTATPAQS